MISRSSGCNRRRFVHWTVALGKTQYPMLQTYSINAGEIAGRNYTELHTVPLFDCGSGRAIMHRPSITSATISIVSVSNLFSNLTTKNVESISLHYGRGLADAEKIQQKTPTSRLRVFPAGLYTS